MNRAEPVRLLSSQGTALTQQGATSNEESKLKEFYQCKGEKKLRHSVSFHVKLLNAWKLCLFSFFFFWQTMYGVSNAQMGEQLIFNKIKIDIGGTFSYTVIHYG